MKKVKHDEDEDQAGAVLLIGAAIIGFGFWAWFRSRRAKEEAIVASRQFRQMPKLNPGPSPARVPQEKQLSLVWDPLHSTHWRGA